MSRFSFKCDIEQPFLQALEAEREKGGWWSEIASDRDLIIALRGDYLNVYYNGQSIFKVSLASGRLQGTTHPKYLLDPGLSKQVSFDGAEFSLGTLGQDAFLERWDEHALLRLKRSAKLYSGQEKQGCHVAVVRNSRLIDVEIAFSRDPESQEERTLPRVDLLLLERVDDHFRLQFWEAKAFGNPELGSMVRATGHSGGPIKREVIGQIANYQHVIADHAEELRRSYAKVCANLVAIYRDTDRYPEGTAVAEVAANPERLVVDNKPPINLLLFGFDKAQKDTGKPAFDQLEQEVNKLGGKLRAIGDAKGAFTS